MNDEQEHPPSRHCLCRACWPSFSDEPFPEPSMTNELPSVGTEDALKVADLLPAFEIAGLGKGVAADAFDMLRALVSERDELASRVRELEGERDQALRNRDMWKGQCERQAEQLTALRVHPHASEAITWTPETGYVYADASLNTTKGGA